MVLCYIFRSRSSMIFLSKKGKYNIKSDRCSTRSYLSITVPKSLLYNPVGVSVAWRRLGMEDREGGGVRADGPQLTCEVLNSEGSHSRLPLTTRPGLDGLDTGG